MECAFSNLYVASLPIDARADAGKGERQRADKQLQRTHPRALLSKEIWLRFQLRSSL